MTLVKKLNSPPKSLPINITIAVINKIKMVMKYDFAIPLPAKRRTINLVAQLTESDLATQILPNENLITISNTISNKLLRWLMSPIEFGYYEDTKQLAFYKGPTNLKDENNKKMKPVYVIFERESYSSRES